jgi:hypothetical protein
VHCKERGATNHKFQWCFEAPWSLLIILGCATLPALGWPLIHHVGTHWLQLGHFQVPLEAPKYSSNPRPFDQKFDVAVLAVPPLFNGLYAPCLIFRYGFHALPLQTHSGFGQYALSRPHYYYMVHHSQTFAKFKLFQWKSQWEPCTSIQVCIWDSPLATFQVFPKAAVRGVQDTFAFCLV